MTSSYVSTMYFDHILSPLPLPVLFLDLCSHPLLSLDSSDFFPIWKKTHGFCFSESGLFHATRWAPGPPIFHKWQNFILLYVWVILHCLYIPHFLYPSVDGHLGWFHSLAIVNSAAIKMGVQVSVVCWLWFLRAYMRDHMVILFVLFWRTLHTDFQVGWPVLQVSPLHLTWKMASLPSKPITSQWWTSCSWRDAGWG
jgi:hypothetical protein